MHVHTHTVNNLNTPTQNESFKLVFLLLILDWVSWLMPIILALGRPRQEDLEFKYSLDYVMGLCHTN